MPSFFYLIKIDCRIGLDCVWLRVKDYFLNSLWQFISAFMEPGVHFISVDLSGASLHRFGFSIPFEEIQFVFEPLCRRREVPSLGVPIVLCNPN